MFSVVYCGLYTIVASIQSVGNILERDNDQAIIMAGSALLVIAGAVIANHVVIKHIAKGWRVVVGIAALSCGFGTVIAGLNVYGALLVIAGLPGIVMALDPSRSPVWARAAFDIDQHSRVLVSTAIAAGTGLVFSDIVLMYFCQPTLVACAMLLVLAGLRCIAGMVLDTGTIKVLEIPKFGTASPLQRAIAVLGVFSWALLPAFLLAVMKVLAVFSTFGIGIGYSGAFAIQIAALAAGIATVTVVWARMEGKKMVQPVLALVLGIVFTVLLVSLVSFPATSKGILDFVQRLAMLFSLPFVVLGIYGGDVPALRTTFLNALRTIAVLLSSVGVVLATLFYTENQPLIFTSIFYVTAATWIVQLVLGTIATSRSTDDAWLQGSTGPVAREPREGRHQ